MREDNEHFGSGVETTISQFYRTKEFCSVNQTAVSVQTEQVIKSFSVIYPVKKQQHFFTLLLTHQNWWFLHNVDNTRSDKTGFLSVFVVLNTHFLGSWKWWLNRGRTFRGRTFREKQNSPRQHMIHIFRHKDWWDGWSLWKRGSKEPETESTKGRCHSFPLWDMLYYVIWNRCGRSDIFLFKSALSDLWRTRCAVGEGHL